MHLFGETLSVGGGIFLLLALGLALSFEFVNGFHDTANAVATVIYTHALKPNTAVIWSGCWNLLGVLTSSGAVAFGVLALLPVELVLNVSSGAGFAMVFGLLISAIIWNLGTWYLGLPASSSHTLIGSIMGVGLANSLLAPGHVFGEGVNWSKANEVGLSLLISPIMGFCGAALLLLLMKVVVAQPSLYRAPEGQKPPPTGIRALLVLTCTGVSFFHGSNDGQKGMGLIMLIIVGVIPGAFAVNLAAQPDALQRLSSSAQTVSYQMSRHAPGITIAERDSSDVLSDFLKTTGTPTGRTFAALGQKAHEIAEHLASRGNLSSLPPAERAELRSDFYLVSGSLAKLAEGNKLDDPAERASAVELRQTIDHVTKFIPAWVKIAVAVALGLGTMIGWKRIVVTLGEKIGKEHLSYAQGAAAELVAMGTIAAADFFGSPVSTTHVLSSGIAGTMAANRSGLQINTLRNLLLAWVLTLPVCVLLGAATFSAGLYIFLHVVGVK